MKEIIACVEGSKIQSFADAKRLGYIDVKELMVQIKACICKINIMYFDENVEKCAYYIKNNVRKIKFPNGKKSIYYYNENDIFAILNAYELYNSRNPYVFSNFHYFHIIYDLFKLGDEITDEKSVRGILRELKFGQSRTEIIIKRIPRIENKNDIVGDYKCFEVYKVIADELGIL